MTKRNENKEPPSFLKTFHLLTGLKGKLDAVDEIEKQLQEENQFHSSGGHFHAPVVSMKYICHL